MSSTFRTFRGFARIERGEAMPNGLTRGGHSRNARTLIGHKTRGHKVWVDLKLLGDPLKQAKTMGFFIFACRIRDDGFGHVELANARGDYVKISE